MSVMQLQVVFNSSKSASVLTNDRLYRLRLQLQRSQFTF